MDYETDDQYIGVADVYTGSGSGTAASSGFWDSITDPGNWLAWYDQAEAIRQRERINNMDYQKQQLQVISQTKNVQAGTAATTPVPATGAAAWIKANPLMAAGLVLVAGVLIFKAVR